MRFLTRAWAAGDLPESETDALWKAYRAHVNSLLPQFSGAVVELASATNLHDGLIRSVVVDHGGSGALSLALICGDQQRGYLDIELEYGDVDIEALDRSMLASLARDRRTEILYDEIDCDRQQTYEHRILFWPEGELSVKFRELSVRKAPRDDRKLEFVGDPYVEIGL